MPVNFFTQKQLLSIFLNSNIAVIIVANKVSIQMCHGNSLYIIINNFAPLFIFLFIRLVSVQSCIPRRAALDQLRGIFDIIQAGRSFIQIKFIIHK